MCTLTALLSVVLSLHWFVDYLPCPALLESGESGESGTALYFVQYSTKGTVKYHRAVGD